MRRILFSSLALLLFFSFRLSAQVTIGNDESAAPGALLQLKDLKNAELGGANSTKGLMLPRVRLTTLSSLQDINPESTERPDPDLHVGLTVYNFNSDGCRLDGPIRSGVYIWDGRVWNPLQPIISRAVETYQDQDGNDFRARTFGLAGTWMIENLKVTKLADNLGGTPLTESLGGTADVKFAYTYPGLNKSNFESNPSLGLLYDWDAATNNKPLTVSNENVRNEVEISRHHEGVHLQGICPEGWHIPTAAEWVELEKEIIRNSSEYSSLSGLTEPAEGLDPANPYNVPNNTNVFYERGTHGVAMKSICYPPGIISGIVAEGNSVYDGGFSIMMAGLVLNGLSTTYGNMSTFFSASLLKNSAGDINTSTVAFYSNLKTVIFNRRLISTSGNAGYLSVRCKKD